MLKPLDANEPALVSIVMPAFNAMGTLPESLASVLEQDYLYWELLVIDDGSHDGTANYIRQQSVIDSRIKLIEQSHNQGVAAARNAGIAAAQGRYIAFLDADDLWFPNKLSAQLRFMQDHQATVCMSAYYRFQHTSNLQKLTTPPHKLTYSNLLKGNAIGNLTGIYDCKSLGKVYQKPVRHEDYLMWLEIVRKAGLAHGCQDALAAYRVCASSLSGNKLKSMLWTWEIYRHHLNLPVVQSGYLMLHYVMKAISKRA